MPLLEHGIDDELLVIESDAVAKYVAQNIPGVDGGGRGEGSMCPETAEEEALVDSFLEGWSRVTDAYYDVLRAASQEEAERRTVSYVKSLGAVDDLLVGRRLEDGGGPFLLGHRFSYAECIAAPWIQRFYVTLPHFRGIDDFESDILWGNDLDDLSIWMRAVCERPSCAASACTEGEMIAACERYYVSFVSPGGGGAGRRGGSSS